MLAEETADYPADLQALNRRLTGAGTESVLHWAWSALGPEVAASSSFQTQSLVLLHLIATTCPELPVIFLDTGFHFGETLAFRDRVVQRLGLRLVVARPALAQAELGRRHGEGLYRADPDLCCFINKVEPMRRAVEGLRGWISGVRRDQTAHREGLRPVERDANGLLRIHPLLDWTADDVAEYLKRHDLPPHPLKAEGYESIGCAPCTRPVRIGENPRVGRWAHTDKTECGLHLDGRDDSETEDGVHG